MSANTDSFADCVALQQQVARFSGRLLENIDESREPVLEPFVSADRARIELGCTLCLQFYVVVFPSAVLQAKILAFRAVFA